MRAQRQSVRAHNRGKLLQAQRRGAADRPVPGAHVRGGRSHLLWGLAAAVVLVAGVGLGITRARQAHLPPLPARDGPEANSPTRDMELRLVEAVRRAPTDAQAHLRLGRFYLEDARPFEALWALRDAQRLAPTVPEPQLLMARALAIGQLYPTALEYLQRVIREHPQDARAAQQLADLQLSLGRPADAVATLQALQMHQTLPDEALLLLGQALEASGRDAAALEQYRRHQEAEPESEQVYRRIGKLLLRIGKARDAQQAFLAAQVLNARSPEARYELGRVELRLGPSHEEAARQKFAEAVALDARFVPAYVQLGAYYQRRRDWGRASNVLNRALQLDPENAEAARQLARARRAMRDLTGAAYYQGLSCDLKDARPQATAHYASLAALEDDPRVPLLVSQGYVKMDQKQRAAEVARDGLRRYPGDVELRERLIAIDLLTGNLKEVEQLCQDWIRRDPTSIRPIWLLGRVRLARHDRATALKLFARAARAEPMNAEYQFWIGRAYTDRPSRGDWEIAARYFGQAVSLKPDDARYRQDLGIALQNIGDLEGARRQFLRAIDRDVNQSAPLNNVVQVARRLKQLDQVEFWAPLVREVEQRLREELPNWKRVWDQPQDADGYLPLARFLKRTGELRKARNILERAVELRPDLRAARQELEELRRTLDVL